MRVESFQFGAEVEAPLEKAIAADPNFAYAHYLLGAVSNAPEKAQPHFEKASELAKTASEGERRFIEALMLMRAQKPADAREILVTLAKEYPEERVVYTVLGQLEISLGHLDDAQASFEHALKLDASTARVYGFLGNINLFKENYSKARELYQTAISKRAPNSTPFNPYYGTVYAYVYEGNIEAALKTLNEFRDIYEKAGGFPGLPPVFIWNSIGRLLLENGRAQESIKAYEQGYETVPKSDIPVDDKTLWLGRLHHGKGRALAKLGKHEEAWKEAELLKSMIEQAGEKGKEYWPSYHYLAGYLKLESGEYAKALEHLKQARQNDLFHLLLLARAYEKSGDQDNAQKIYREIVNSKQNNLERALSYPEAKRKLKS
jgi:tetratricopeptide (TPR) repeat protein